MPLCDYNFSLVSHLSLWNTEETGTGAGKRTKISHTNSSSLSAWDIDAGLAADFDGSLSGLGTELGTSSYNMSEALLALPVFKQENIENGFQYILGAATSPAVKMNEETLTYLNQGQSYEIKLKKLGDLSNSHGKLLKSLVRVHFHERRLQYMEKQQIETWKQNRPGERILDIDIPLSYGLIDVNLDPIKLNEAEFIWDPTKSTGIYIRVHCISTEFTAKKHGGEKGVPFRIQLDTFSHEEEEEKLLHSASCQVKVFKPKGADRKHKTDREKMDKRSESEKEKYQPSYECTVLTEVSFVNIRLTCVITVRSPPPTPITPLSHSNSSTPVHNSSTNHVQSSSSDDTAKIPLLGDATAAEVTQWLHYHRFSHYVRIFQNFSGADLLRLTRDDLIQICGLADGIRLNNALQSRSVRPRLTIYVCQESESSKSFQFFLSITLNVQGSFHFLQFISVYHAVYLEQMTVSELASKLAALFGIQLHHIGDIYTQGPSGIHILVTNEVGLGGRVQSGRLGVGKFRFTGDE
ncbi:hypothetical protein LOTGIDRAFT_128306 [Lottia gigantea]|uniref:Grh/CP2 DB domain-containing protein n=1 Tax=Lottia gigantea TaxID=225164 RepID=V3ZW88_LOTGI|nr:hypothetical protein LOTGIDRAFT_128306 [Lottia gigantea]ESO86835.1 hypothetical protein LOTGIDRAFT_128306 [Lottia gigantea]